MKHKKTILFSALLAAFSLTATAGVTAMAEKVSVDTTNPTSVNVVRGLTASAFSVTDYEGNVLKVAPGNFTSGDFDYTVHNLNDGYKTSWSGIAASPDGTNKTLGWFNVDLGATMVMNKIVIDMQHDWAGKDFILQIASKPDFSDATTIYNNDSDNSMGLGGAFTADPSVAVTEYLSNSGAADDGSTGKGGNIFNFAPVAGRYVRVTNNQYGDGAVLNYSAIGEIEVYAYEIPSVNVARSLSTDAFSVTDYEGNPIEHLIPGRNVDSNSFDYTFKNLNDGYKTSWSAVVPSVDGTSKSLGWFNVDLGQEHTVTKLMVSMQHDWEGQDVVIQLAKQADFSDAITVYSNDIDNSLNLGDATVANVPRNTLLNNFGSAGQSTGDNGNYFIIAPTVARYVRVTNNQYGDDQLHNYTAIGEIEVYASTGDINVEKSNQISPVGFSEVSGTYGKELSVALATAQPGADIYYTTDGSVPTLNSAKYSEPIQVAMNSKVMIRAAAAVDGVLGLPTIAQYVTQDPNIGKNIALNKPVKVMSYDMTEDWSDQVYSVNKMNSNGTLKEEGADDVKYITDGKFDYYYVISTYHKYANGGQGGGNGVGWAVVDFGAAYVIDYVRYDAYWDWQTYNHVIQLANKADFSDAVTVYENADRIMTGKKDGAKTDGMIIDVEDTNAYRYIRVSNASTNHSSNPMSVFTEIQAYVGGASDTPMATEQPYLVSYDAPEAVTVAIGTAWSAIELPTELNVTLSDGSTKAVAGTCVMPDDYDGKAGSYTAKFMVTDASAFSDAYGLLDNFITVNVEKAKPTIAISVASRIVCDGNAPTVSIDASSEGYTVQYYQGETLLDAAPTTAGSYTVVVSLAETDNSQAASSRADFTMVDYRALSAKIDEVVAMNENVYMSDSWATLSEALTSAQAVLGNDAAVQTEIDGAIESLVSAVNALVLKGNKTALQEKYDAVKDIENVYTSASWTAFSAALTEAKALLDAAEATQATIDAELADLTAAHGALVVKANFAALQTAVDAAKALTLDSYVTAGKDTFTAALTAAEAILANDETAQNDIDAAKTALEAAQAALVLKGDKTALNALVAEVDALAEADYTAATWATLSAKLTAAKAVVADADATQADVDAAKADLEAAKTALELKPAPVEEGGCGSTVAVGAVALATVAFAGMLISKKRKDEELF